jgi:hypothetical protein
MQTLKTAPNLSNIYGYFEKGPPSRNIIKQILKICGEG